MEKFVIKCTHTAGIHAGKVFYLEKGGYVCWECSTGPLVVRSYKTLAAAKAAARKFQTAHKRHMDFMRDWSDPVEYVAVAV